jgi:uncharacterized protein with NAD-binding domain and iron-sulfur cluster
MVEKGTASMPARKISTLKAAAKNENEMTAHAKLLKGGASTPSAFGILGSKLLKAK